MKFFETIICDLLDGTKKINTYLTKDLLEAFYDGLSLRYLEALLEAENIELALAGAFILSELDQDCDPQVTSLAIRCLDHTHWDMRYHGLRCFHFGQFVPPQLRVKIFILLSDEHSLVRLMALRLANLMSIDDYKYVYNFTHLDKAFDEARYELEFFFSSTDLTQNQISKKINSDIRLERYFGALAASKSELSKIPLMQEAAKSEDREVSRFATKILDDLLGSTSQH